MRCFSKNWDEEERRSFREVAIEGRDILGGMVKRAWALEVPWRVRILKVGFNGQRELGEKNSKVKGIEGEMGGKKKKSGKKRRILLRKVQKEKDEDEQRKKKELEGKEEAEKEKRVRRNREKKLKRKAKEKATKSGGEDGHVVMGGVDGLNE